MTPVRIELFEIGELAAEVLTRFVSIQNNIRTWKILLFVPVDFTQHAKDARSIGGCFDELVTRLENIVTRIDARSVEDDLRPSVGALSLRLKNATSSYDYLTRFMDYHSRKERLRGVLQVSRARRAFDRDVDNYRFKGIILNQVWKRAREA